MTPGRGSRRITGRSPRRPGATAPAYERLATAVCDDLVILGFLGSLPLAKRQPNLLFAAARYLLGGTPDPDGLRELAIRDASALAGVIMARRTQTNEPARCATLLPALALLPQPLALIEAGASAGLTLLFDRYSYDFAGHKITGSDPLAPVLRCEPRGPVPLPGQPIPPYQGVPFVHARDGDTVLALTDSHGTWLQWLPRQGQDHPQSGRRPLTESAERQTRTDDGRS